MQGKAGLQHLMTGLHDGCQIVIGWHLCDQPLGERHAGLLMLKRIRLTHCGGADSGELFGLLTQRLLQRLFVSRLLTTEFEVLQQGEQNHESLP